MALLITVFIFMTVITVIAALYFYFMTERQAVRQRLNHYVIHPAENPAEVSEGRRAELGGWRLTIRHLSKYLEAYRWSSSLEQKLAQAGLPLRGSEFLVFEFFSVLSCAILLFALSGGTLLAALVGGMIGYVLPVLYLRIKIDRRVKAFNSQLGDALILIANSLRTGYSFMQAIEMVAKEMLPPISSEFARVLKEMNLGVTTEEALNNLAKRVNSDNLELVITAVLIQRQVGGNLAEVLDNISHTIRERVKIKGQIRTMTAQGRISGMIIGALPVCIGGILYIINPEYIKVLFTHPLGQAMLAGGLVSQVIGVIFIRKIIAIEV